MVILAQTQFKESFLSFPEFMLKLVQKSDKKLDVSFLTAYCQGFKIFCPLPIVMRNRLYMGTEHTEEDK